jgi:hypothetical protein
MPLQQLGINAALPYHTLRDWTEPEKPVAVEMVGPP